MMEEVRQKKIKVELYNDHYTIYNGSMLDMKEVIKPNSIDSIICDPPYHLTSITERFGKENSAPAKYGEDGSFSRLSKGFMNQTWDGGDIAFRPETWRKCYEVLKPGGYLLAFGGSRTFHRLAVAIEDAGFEIRDTIMWLYGSGFPKSMDVSKALEAKEKYGKTNTVAKKQVEQSGNGKEYKIKQTNNGAMGEIVETTRKVYIPSTELAKQWQGWGTCLKPAYEPIIVARKPLSGTVVDNVLTYGVGGINIDGCRVKTDDIMKPRNNKVGQNGIFNSSGGYVEPNELGRFPANVIHDDSFQIDEETQANRYFYSAKASKKDRDEGLDVAGFEEKQVYGNDMIWGYGNDNGDNLGERIANVKRKNTHPTVKPTELMQYLVRLVSPKGATILDPFMGSGSTGKAVMFENRERNANYKFIGIDLTEEYCHLAIARIDYALNKFEYDYIKEKQEAEARGQANIFDFIEE